MTADLTELAAEAGAGDLLVLRRIDGGRFALLGGAGRGADWAGVVDVDVDDEPAALAALASGSPQLVQGDEPQRVLGPYWSLRAMLAPVDRDAIVLLGGLVDSSPDPNRMQDVAFRAALQVDRVPPGKRVADDLAVVEAVRAVMAVDASAARPTLRRVAALITEVLDADLGVLWLRASGEVATAGRHAHHALQDGSAGIALAMAELAEGREPHLAQDASLDPLPGPLGAVTASSWAFEPLGALGGLVVVHDRERACGFTTRCRDLAMRLAEAAAIVLHAATVRERLDAAAAALGDRARRDELTGAVNRGAWEDALAVTPSPATALVLSVGAPAPREASTRHLQDELLRAAAVALRGALRDGDTVARLGGETFGVLLPGIESQQALDVVARLRAALASAPPVHGLRLEARIAAASSPAEPSAAAAALVAEARAACARRP